MKIALIGSGAMGKIVSEKAAAAGHRILVTVDAAWREESASKLAGMLLGANVVIDFSEASAVARNVEACVLAGLPLVEGTTGWLEGMDEIKKMVSETGGAMVYGANFSIGVNILYRITDLAANLFARFPAYEPFIEEQHHSRKKDSPSGTALCLKDTITKHSSSEISCAVTRAGNIPGTHRVGFDGASDQVVLEHIARSREGFALGALFAAEWIVGRKGFYEFGEAMDEICR